MRQGFKPLADYRANRGFWPLARDRRNRVFPMSSPVTKYSQKTRFLATHRIMVK